MSIPFLFCAFITAVSAVVSLGFSIAAAFNTANDVRRSRRNRAPESCSNDLVAELALLIERPMSIADYSIAGVEARSSLVQCRTLEFRTCGLVARACGRLAPGQADRWPGSF